MKEEFKSFNDFKREVATNTDLQNKLREDPVTALQQLHQESPLNTDRWIYRIVVTALGLTIISIIIGILILIGNGRVNNDQSVPTILTAIGSAAIGALAGLLAPSPKGNNNA